MSKKNRFVISLISIFSPILLVLFFGIAIIFEKISRTNFIYAVFSRLSLFWMFTGWIVGLITGIIGVVLSVKNKKESKQTESSIYISIIGIVLNVLWITGIIFMFPAWMGI